MKVISASHPTVFQADVEVPALLAAACCSFRALASSSVSFCGYEKRPVGCAGVGWL